MKRFTPFLKHWRTSLLGLLCLAMAVWSMDDTWNPTQTLLFHVTHVWCGQMAELLIGVALLFAADHNHVP